MSLRFQDEDEVDRRVSETKRTTFWLIAAILLLAAVWYGLDAWSRGASLGKFVIELGGLIAVCWVGWVSYPIYLEFRIRTKEIDGKISAAEAAMNETNERYLELLHRLAAIETRLDDIQDADRR